VLTTPGLLQRSEQALKPDIGSESRFLPTTPAFDAPVRESCRRNIAIPFGIGKTRMAWLPDGEKNSKISLFILIERKNMADTQTHTQTDTA